MMKGSITIASCVLTLSVGTALAKDLHVTNPNPPASAASAAPGQTGSNVLASCGPTEPTSLSVGSINGVPAKMTTGVGSPFNPSATKTYAGNTGNPPGNPTLAKNPIAVSQYDNACAQAALRKGAQLP